MTAKAKYILKIIAEIEYKSSDKRAIDRNGCPEILNIINQIISDLQNAGRSEKSIDISVIAAQAAYAIRELLDAKLIKAREIPAKGYHRSAVLYETQVTLKEILAQQ